MPRNISKKRRNKPGKNQALEQALFEWICEQQTRRININGEMVRQKAFKIQQLANEKIPAEHRISLQFSEGWLDKFKHRWNLRVFKSHGESGDADADAVAREMPRLRGIVAEYAKKDVFNADECGLFYRMAPDKTIALERLPGRKKAKERITIMPCANADGTEKIELMFIGSALNPASLKRSRVRNWDSTIMPIKRHG